MIENIYFDDKSYLHPVMNKNGTPDFISIKHCMGDGIWIRPELIGNLIEKLKEAQEAWCKNV